MSFLNNSVISNSTGSARAAQGQSATSFLASVLGGSASAIVQLAIFALLKDKLPKL
jgi:hypothetical protein